MLLPSSFEDAPAHEAPPPGPWGSVKNAFGIVHARQKEEHVLQSCQPTGRSRYSLWSCSCQAVFRTHPPTKHHLQVHGALSRMPLALCLPGRKKNTCCNHVSPQEDLGTAFGHAPAKQFSGRNRPRSTTSRSMGLCQECLWHCACQAERRTPAAIMSAKGRSR